MKTLAIWTVLATAAQASLAPYTFTGQIIETKGPIFENIELTTPVNGFFQYELDPSKWDSQGSFDQLVFYVDVGDPPVRFEAGIDPFILHWGGAGWAGTRPATEVTPQAFFHLNAILRQTNPPDGRWFYMRFVDEDGLAFADPQHLELLPEDPHVFEERRMFVNYDRDNGIVMDINSYRLVPEPSSIVVWLIGCCLLLGGRAKDENHNQRCK